MDSIKAGIAALGRANEPLSLRLTVAEVRPLSPGFTRVVLEGAALAQYRAPRPADAFKLELSADDTGRPLLRAFTVRRFDADTRRLTLDIARHERGVAVNWLATVSAGDAVTLAGMRPEWVVAEGFRDHILVGDDTAVPAIAAIVDSLGPEHRIRVYAALTDPADRALLPEHPNLELELLDSVTDLENHPPEALSEHRTQVWVAAEAAAVRRVRAHLLGSCGVARADLLARAYWKRGKTNTDTDAASLLGYREAMRAGGDIHDPALAERIDLGL
ncbi:siderophore-interacting protein [Nocardia asteroides]|uniref:siderophore-interacting protein n=1 Tax=Nocardia asteroides TaxID=1824 RepID=UPI001E5613AF|nr:siderophore-interacting protein [Nocardia asteroides]UGT62570.1 siderophore-interacting protein [Nocardia asteroides]